MASTFLELIQTFVYTFFALAMNTIFITMAEVNARTKTNTSATPEDDALKVKLGVIPPATAAAAAQPNGAAAAPVAPGSVTVHVDGAHNGNGNGAAAAPVAPAGPAHVGAASLNGSLVKPESVARANAAHHNATENFVPYIMAVVPYILSVAFQKSGERDDTLPVIILMCIYTFARWVHTISYLGGYQPWRSIGFLTGMFSMGIISCYSVVAASKLSKDIN